MAKNYFKLFLATLTLALFASFASCNSEDVDYIPASISVEPTTILIEAGDDEITPPILPEAVSFEVDATRGWVAEFNNESVRVWLELSATKGKSGKTTITARTSVNAAEKPRTAIVSFKVPGNMKPAVLTITQVGTGGFEPIGDLILNETFGTGGSNTTTPSGWTGYVTTGTGKDGVTYDGTSTTIRSSGGGSSGYEGASGGNNAFFGGASNNFDIKNIDVTGHTKMTLSFGVTDYGYDAESKGANYPITASSFTIQGSLDGTAWTDLPFTNEATVPWVLITSEFEVPSGSTTLFLRVKDAKGSLGTGSSVRVDDISLYAGGAGGVVIGGGGPGPEPTDAILKESFGAGATKPEGGEWPLVGEWTAYSKEGTGMANVTYTGTSTSIRVSTASTGYPGATGSNNLFFGALPNDFVISKINVTGKEKLTLTFGISDSSATASPWTSPVSSTAVKVQGSLDGISWTALTYANSADPTWVLATTEFQVPAGSTDLYLKFEDGQGAGGASKIRIDDIILNVGTIGGTVIGGGGPGPEPTGAILKESFGEGATKPELGQWPTVGEWTKYSKEGTGMANVAYAGANTSIRVSTASTGYPGATGSNNLFFGALPNDFVISKINVTGKEKLTLTFGISDSSATASPWTSPVSSTAVKVQGSLDGISWTALTYANSADPTWVLATTEFQVPAGSTDLYLKFEDGQGAGGASKIRIDDIILNVGTIGGTVIGGGGPGPEPTEYIYGESFGVPTSNTAISSWTGWVTTGTGKANVSYTGSNTTIRKSLPSTGYEGATGDGSVFFAAASSHFTVAKIGVTDETKLTLKFGISDNSGAAPTYMSPVSATTVKVQGSLDGIGWTPLTYTNSADPAWVIATVEFQVPAGTTELYLKFEDGLGVGGVGSKVRIDDIILSKGTIGGTVIGAALPEVKKTIADLRAMLAGTITDNIYVTGFVIGQSNSASQSNLIIQDATGGIMFRETSFGDFTIFAEGDEVKVKLGNANMTEYEGLKQVGLLVAAVSKTGTTTAQTPKVITATQLVSGAFESQLVSVANVQVIAADLSKTMDGVVSMESSTGETFGMYTSINAPFKGTAVPTGSGTLFGVASVNSGIYQIIPQITTDFSGLTGARFGGLSFATPEFVTDLTVGTAIVGDITLQYFDALGTESYNIDVAVSGAGSAGITVASIVANLTIGSGTITIPVTGTPTTIGAVEFTISGITELTTTVVTATVLPAGGADYNSNVSLPAADDSTLKHYKQVAKIEGTDYNVLKLGTGSVGGSYTTEAMGNSGTVTLKFYGVAWAAKSGKVTITVNGGGTINGAASVEQDFAPNAGATGNPPYTITFEASDFYSFTLDGLTAESTLTFASPASAPRVIMAGIRVE